MPGPNYAAAHKVVIEDTVTQKVVIEDTVTQKVAMHVGGGWYELSDGSRIKGKDAATEAQAKL